jgi:imidazole glycerol phosphate synthase subunit HisF
MLTKRIIPCRHKNDKTRKGVINFVDLRDAKLIQWRLAKIYSAEGAEVD